MPDIYLAYERKPELVNAPWKEAGAAVPGCRFTAFNIQAASESDATTILKEVLRPFVTDLDEYGADALSPVYFT